MPGYSDLQTEIYADYIAQLSARAASGDVPDLPFNHVAGRAAVLLIDPQVYFCDPARRGTAETAAVAKKIQQAMWDFRHAGIPVYVVRTMRPFNAASLPQDHAFYHFTAAPGDKIFDKFTDSAFPDMNRMPNDLTQELRRNNVTQLLIAGFNYSGCVKKTAMNALHHGFFPVVMKSLCADDKTNIAEAPRAKDTDAHDAVTTRLLKLLRIPVKDFGEVYERINPPRLF